MRRAIDICKAAASFFLRAQANREEVQLDARKTNSMLGVNRYGSELTQDEIRNRVHRSAVGGLWDELGQLQYEFLVKQGMTPSHKLLDIGCGSLRGGLHYIRYLDEGNYCGLDVSASLIEAGRLEIQEAGLDWKNSRLLVDDQFRLNKFELSFDFMVSISVFTHLPMNPIIRCLCEARKCLKPGGVYFSTFFQAPTSAYLDKLRHDPGEIVTNYDSDPFHYSFEELAWMAGVAGLNAKLLGDWGHPRNQKMASFSVRG